MQSQVLQTNPKWINFNSFR